MSSNNYYYRKTSPQITILFWQIIEEIHSHNNYKQFNRFNELFINLMFHKFKIQLSEEELNKLINDMIDDKLIIKDGLR